MLDTLTTRTLEFTACMQGLTLTVDGLGNYTIEADDTTSYARHVGPGEISYDTLYEIAYPGIDDLEEWEEDDWYTPGSVGLDDLSDTVSTASKALVTCTDSHTRSVLEAVLGRAVNYGLGLVVSCLYGDDLRGIGNWESALHAAGQIVEEAVALDRSWSRRTAGHLHTAIDEEDRVAGYLGLDIDQDDLDDMLSLTLPPISGGADIASTIRAVAREARGLQVLDHDPIEGLVIRAQDGDTAARRSLRRMTIQDRRTRTAQAGRTRTRTRTAHYGRAARHQARAALRDLDW